MGRPSFNRSIRRFAALSAPFYLNDVVYAVLTDRPYGFFAVDVFCRLWVVGGMAWLIARGEESAEGLGFRVGDKNSFALGMVALPLLSVALFLFARPFVAGLFPEWRLFSFPPYPSAPMRVFDMAVAMPLVGLTEEFVFRGYLQSHLQRRGMRARAAIPIVAALFGLIHWGLGAGDVVATALWSVPLSLFVWYRGSLWPAILAHALTDAVAFWPN